MYFSWLRVLTLAGLMLVFVRVFAQAPDTPYHYLCYRAPQPLVVDGHLTDEAWHEAPWSRAFTDIEGAKKPAPLHETRVKMLWDDDYFYFAAQMKEPHVWAHITEPESVIFYDDDFEIFIDPNGDHVLYYEYEVNALNTVWDLMLTRSYYSFGKAITAWDIEGLQSAVQVQGTLNNPADKDTGWTVEVAMPWRSLTEALPHKGTPKPADVWRINFSRVDWVMETQDGRYVKKKDAETGQPLPERNWVWSPQGVIDMHRPETWGFVQFVGNPAGQHPAKAIPPVDWPTRQLLVDVYHKQRAFFYKHKHYATSAKELGINDRVQIATTATQFLASARGKSGRLWLIDQYRHLQWKNQGNP